MGQNWQETTEEIFSKNYPRQIWCKSTIQHVSTYALSTRSSDKLISNSHFMQCSYIAHATDILWYVQEVTVIKNTQSRFKFWHLHNHSKWISTCLSLFPWFRCYLPAEWMCRIDWVPSAHLTRACLTALSLTASWSTFNFNFQTAAILWGWHAAQSSIEFH